MKNGFVRKFDAYYIHKDSTISMPWHHLAIKLWLSIISCSPRENLVEHTSMKQNGMGTGPKAQYLLELLCY